MQAVADMSNPSQHTHSPPEPASSSPVSPSVSHSASARSTGSKNSSSPGRKDTNKDGGHKRPDLGGLSGADIDQVKRRPPTYQAKDADLRRLLNSGDYVPTEVRCDVCTSRDWPCVERRPTGKNRRAVATSCAGCQISHKKCRINGQRRADVLALRHSEKASTSPHSKEASLPRIGATSHSPEARGSAADSAQFRPRPRQHSLRISPAPFTPLVGPPVPGRWGSHRDLHRSPDAYYPSSAYPIDRRPYGYSPYRYAPEIRYPSDSPYSSHPTHSPYLHSPYRSSPTAFAYEYSRPAVLPTRPELMHSPVSALREHRWTDRDRILPPPPLPAFSRMPAVPISPVHMNPIRPFPRPQSVNSQTDGRSGSDIGRSTASYHSDRDCDSNPSLPSPRTILSWSEADDRNDSSPSHHFKRPRQVAAKAWSPPLTERRSESPPIGLTTPPPSITSGSSTSILRKRAFSASSAGSGGDFKRMRSAWWHTIEDTRFPEARYHVEDSVFNDFGSSFMLSEPRPRALRPVDAQRIPYLEHITQLDKGLVRLLSGTRRAAGDVIQVPAYLYRPRVSCASCAQDGTPCVISGDDIELPRHTPPGTMIVPLPSCLACRFEGKSCVYRLATKHTDVLVPLRVAMFESRPRLMFPVPLSSHNIEQWGVCYSPGDVVPPDSAEV